MKNFVQRGDVVSAVAPYALASGDGAKVGGMFGVACGNAANGSPVEISRHGIYDLAAVAADTGAVGAKIYWDDTARKLTTTVSGNTLVGCLVWEKANGEATARVLLDGTVR